MDRRTLLALTPKLFLLTLTGLHACRRPSRNERKGLFFEPEDLPRIRANAHSPLLEETFTSWAHTSEDETLAVLRRPLESGDVISDLARTFRRMEELSVVYLVTEDPSKGALLLEGIDCALALPKWDWFMDGKTEIGIMRASQAVGSLLLAAEVLGDTLSHEKKSELYRALAAKGVQPCNRAIYGMDHPEEVQGWHADELRHERYPYDMSRWPTIFSGINLRAVPTMGLGLGALALEGRDERAGEWLARAVGSAKTHLAQYRTDGSYWEGISYVNYALSTLFVFLEAYDRLKGDVNWLQYANFKGVNAYVAAMQMGRETGSDDPDIVNFSDARTSTSVAVNAWLAQHTHDPLAQYNVEHFSQKRYFADFLWYRPGLPSSPPPPALLNVRLDLDWVIARTGWEAQDAVLAFRSGGPANHEHADRNSFIYKIFGERLLTDQFGASYDPRLPHWLLRQTEAHNAVLVDGRGHQYVDGSEGTNAGKASARILRYVEDGTTIWWSSDATPGYRMVNANVRLIRRSMLFLKPDWVVVFDELDTERAPASFAARFFPDNRDDKAGISAEGREFVLTRPSATLTGWTASNVGLSCVHGALDLPETYGSFPFAEVRAKPGRRVEIVTILHAKRAGEEPPDKAVTISRLGETWRLEIPVRPITIGIEKGLPAFDLG